MPDAAGYLVITGLDPVIHPLGRSSLVMDAQEPALVELADDEA